MVPKLGDVDMEIEGNSILRKKMNNQEIWSTHQHLNENRIFSKDFSEWVAVSHILSGNG